MAEKTKQKLMYSDKELELIKGAFCENEELLILMRKLWHGVELSSESKELIKNTFKNKELVEAVRHKVYGLNNLDTPLGQVSDFWLGVEKQIFGASRDTIEQAVQSKALVLSMFEKAMLLLENPDGEKVDTSVSVSSVDGLQIKIIARNLYVQAIETALLTLFIIAGKKEETVEQTRKRLEQDSSK